MSNTHPRSCACAHERPTSARVLEQRLAGLAKMVPWSQQEAESWWETREVDDSSCGAVPQTAWRARQDEQVPRNVTWASSTSPGTSSGSIHGFLPSTHVTS